MGDWFLNIPIYLQNNLVFRDKNYGGENYCLTPSIETSGTQANCIYGVGLFDTNVGGLGGMISSIRRGCYSSEATTVRAS